MSRLDFADRYHILDTSLHEIERKRNMGFDDLKKNSGAFDRLSKELNKLTKKSSDSYKDDRFWRPELDKASNGYAVIRFLPEVTGEDIPWAMCHTHGFQGPGGWFIENCPTTVGKKCPVCEANSRLWKSGDDGDKDIARSRKRRLHYVSNILVINDPANPDNEGKVFLFKYGKKIHDKIVRAMQPDDDETPINPFDFWKGADFKLKIRKVAGYVNYDESRFTNPSALFGGDDNKLKDVYKKQYPLKEFVSAESHKSYEELKARFDVVMGLSESGIPRNTSAEDVDLDEDEEVNTPKFKPSGVSKPNPPKATAPSKKTPPKVEQDEDESDDAMSYFERLAAED